MSKSRAKDLPDTCGLYGRARRSCLRKSSACAGAPADRFGRQTQRKTL